jgi:predicted RNase H-like HicB family nuclease
METDVLADYLRLPYRVEVIKNEDGYFAWIPELPGCMTWADRIESIWPLIEDAKEAWIADALASGDTVPLPKSLDDPAETAINVPRPLHQLLVRQAEEAGLSLDELIVRRLG